MLTLLRKMRRKVLNQAMIRNYILYAIGEILLVSVGILLALYVNNNNEHWKQQVKSAEILSELKKNLAANSKQFQDEIALEEKVIASVDAVIRNLREVRVYNDSLEYHFSFCGFWPTSSWESSGYAALKSSGADLIESEVIRKGIIELYEIKYPSISEFIRNSEGYSYSTLVPYFSEIFYFKEVTPGQSYADYSARPFDYDQILQSNKLQGMLSFWRTMRVVGIDLRRAVIEANENLIDLIIDELNNM